MNDNQKCPECGSLNTHVDLQMSVTKTERERSPRTFIFWYWLTGLWALFIPKKKDYDAKSDVVLSCNKCGYQGVVKS